MAKAERLTQAPSSKALLEDRERVKEMFVFTETLKMKTMAQMNSQMAQGLMFNVAVEAILQ